MKHWFAICLSLLLIGCSKPEPEPISESTEFTRAAPQPQWFGKTEAQTLNSRNEVQALWSSEKRCCDDDRGVVKANREFYKSCYRAIEGKPEDVHLTPYCLWLMGVALDYEASIGMSRYLLKNHLYYSQLTDTCANCSPADLIARVARDVALYDARQAGVPEQAAELLETLLDEREALISAWVLGEIYVALAEIYEALPNRTEQVAALERRVARLEADWPEGLQAWRLEDVRSAMRILKETP